MKVWLLVAVGLVAAAQAGRAQDAGNGEAVFKNLCLPCHSVGEAATNKVGPMLNGLAGRRAGTVSGFSYSQANRDSGIVWDAATFQEYIREPKARIPGTRMPFAGLKDQQQGKDLWAYISQFTSTGTKK